MVIGKVRFAIKTVACDSLIQCHGWVAERFKAPVLKTGVGASSPWVRIPPHPPYNHPLPFAAIRNSAQIREKEHLGCLDASVCVRHNPVLLDG